MVLREFLFEILAKGPLAAWLISGWFEEFGGTSEGGFQRTVSKSEGRERLMSKQQYSKSWKANVGVEVNESMACEQSQKQVTSEGELKGDGPGGAGMEVREPRTRRGIKRLYR